MILNQIHMRFVGQYDYSLCYIDNKFSMCSSKTVICYENLFACFLDT